MANDVTPGTDMPFQLVELKGEESAAKEQQRSQRSKPKKGATHGSGGGAAGAHSWTCHSAWFPLDAFAALCLHLVPGMQGLYVGECRCLSGQFATVPHT
mmetsp:Transcript_27253/g.80825  ORF Transcript_27253/g.80825 Transcript_27253/m.80825 type:complete len:99 (-) Transcript_27253:53-349(-)